MKVAVFSTKGYDREFLDAANLALGGGHDLVYLETRLNRQSALLAQGHQAICAFVNDELDKDVLAALAAHGTRLIALRCAGFNHVDLTAAMRLNLTVARVPAYSPHAVAEHTVALILALNRKIHKAYARVREGNFALDGLLGFDLEGRTIGIVGTGKIGLCVARIMHGFGCTVLGCDPAPDRDFIQIGGRYATFAELLAASDIVSLHCPLTPDTRYLIDASAIATMKAGSMLVNTGRGALVETQALIAGLKSGQLGNVALDVYEEEGDLFFENLSDQILHDDVFARLLTFPNVLVTGHQAFFTQEALTAIARTTIGNITQFETTGHVANSVSVEKMV